MREGVSTRYRHFCIGERARIHEGQMTKKGSMQVIRASHLTPWTILYLCIQSHISEPLKSKSQLLFQKLKDHVSVSKWIESMKCSSFRSIAEKADCLRTHVFVFQKKQVPPQTTGSVSWPAQVPMAQCYSLKSLTPLEILSSVIQTSISLHPVLSRISQPEPLSS